ncbi:MAG: T9SS type A sorting domain-containing protein, partial [Saprospiraceae bacterium]
EEANIQIFPNPTSDILNIKMENSSQANFSIFDIYGKKVLEKMEVNQNKIQLSTSTFSSGIYFLKIEMEGKEFVQKFIKM